MPIEESPHNPNPVGTVIEGIKILVSVSKDKQPEHNAHHSYSGNVLKSKIQAQQRGLNTHHLDTGDIWRSET